MNNFEHDERDFYIHPDDIAETNPSHIKKNISKCKRKILLCILIGLSVLAISTVISLAHFEAIQPSIEAITACYIILMAISLILAVNISQSIKTNTKLFLLGGMFLSAVFIGMSHLNTLNIVSMEFLIGLEAIVATALIINTLLNISSLAVISTKEYKHYSEIKMTLRSNKNIRQPSYNINTDYMEKNTTYN